MQHITLIKGINIMTCSPQRDRGGRLSVVYYIEGAIQIIMILIPVMGDSSFETIRPLEPEKRPTVLKTADVFLNAN